MKDFKQLYNRILVFNVVLLLGIIALFVLHFTADLPEGTSVQQTEEGTASTDTASSIISERIAVVKLDTLLLEYKLAQDLNEDLLQRQKMQKHSFNRKW